MAQPDESVHLSKSKQSDELTEQQVQRMIRYLAEHTDYKVVTREEFQMFKPLAESTPSASGGVRPKHPNTRFEDQAEQPIHDLRTSPSMMYEPSYIRPRFPNFSGEAKSETSFDVWKNDVKCALRDGTCSTSVLRQAIRSSLKGKARASLLTLPTDATPEQILEKLEGIYGNIYPSEQLLQQFYAASQAQDESVADYGMRLESLLQTCIDRGAIGAEGRDSMLRAKLWSGLSDPGLRNASRYKYDTVTDFEALRRELRTIELDLTSTVASTSPPSSKPTDKKKSQVSQIGNTRGDPAFEAILKKLDGMDKRIIEVEREIKRSQNNSGLPRNLNQRYHPDSFEDRGYDRNYSFHNGDFRNVRRGQRGGSRPGSRGRMFGPGQRAQGNAYGSGHSGYQGHNHANNLNE